MSWKRSGLCLLMLCLMTCSALAQEIPERDWGLRETVMRYPVAKAELEMLRGHMVKVCDRNLVAVRDSCAAECEIYEAKIAAIEAEQPAWWNRLWIGVVLGGVGGYLLAK